MIGLKRGTVKLVKHSPKWKQDFEREAKKIKKVFGKNAIDIQHVGSTSIAGILAKPIIDIALVVPSLQRARRYRRELKTVGYSLKKNDPRKDRLFFTKGSEARRTHYLHVGQVGSGYAEDMILFRDYLRKYKGSARRYSELKSRLAERFKNLREAYTLNKERFVRRIVEKANKVLKKEK